jgi:hypothetical protein
MAALALPLDLAGSRRIRVRTRTGMPTGMGVASGIPATSRGQACPTRIESDGNPVVTGNPGAESWAGSASAPVSIRTFVARGGRIESPTASSYVDSGEGVRDRDDDGWVGAGRGQPMVVSGPQALAIGGPGGEGTSVPDSATANRCGTASHFADGPSNGNSTPARPGSDGSRSDSRGPVRSGPVRSGSDGPHLGSSEPGQASSGRDDPGPDRTFEVELSPVRLATRRFLATCVEVIGGYRPLAQLRPLCAPENFADISHRLARHPSGGAGWRTRGLAHLGSRGQLGRTGVAGGVVAPPRTGRAEQKGPGDRVVIRRVQICETVDGVAEIAVVLARRDQVWAMALRLERQRGQWLCAHLEVI